jgi:hypothetical protein
MPWRRRPCAATMLMKNVLVCSTQTPFVVGGAEILAADLRLHFECRGFRVDTVNLPFDRLTETLR